VVSISEVDKILREAVVIDGLGPIFWYQEDKETYLKTVHRSGLTAFSHTMILPYDFMPDGFLEFVEAAEEWHRMSENDPDILTVAHSASEILQAKRDGRVAVIFSLQNPFPIGAHVEYLAALYRLGLRICQLTYQRRSLLADGCGEPGNAGLSSLGKSAVAEMNRVHIVIDLSHCGERSSLETIEISKDPVIVSHAGVRELTDTTRNISNEQIDAVVNRDGVIGVMAEKEFIRREGRSYVDAYVDHIEFLLDRAGDDDHVGMGLDLAEGFPESRLRLFQRMLPETGMKEVDYAVPELNSPTKLPNLIERLISRRHTSQTIRKILGLNFLRVFEQVWDGRSSGSSSDPSVVRRTGVETRPPARG
jgi:membrane dipeptidase